MLFAHWQALGRLHARRLLLGGVELGEAAQRFLRRRVAPGGVHIEEFSSDVGQASPPFCQSFLPQLLTIRVFHL